MEFDQKTVAGQTKTGRIFILGDVTVYDTKDDCDGGFRSVILFNDKTKQVEGFIVKRDGIAVPFDAETFVPSDAKTVAATKEQIDAVVNFGARLMGSGSLKSLRRYRKSSGIPKRRKRKRRDEATRRA